MPGIVTFAHFYAQNRHFSSLLRVSGPDSSLIPTPEGGPGPDSWQRVTILSKSDKSAVLRKSAIMAVLSLLGGIQASQGGFQVSFRRNTRVHYPALVYPPVYTPPYPALSCVHRSVPYTLPATVCTPSGLPGVPF